MCILNVKTLEVKILSAKCKSSFAQTCESGPKIGEACQWVFQAPEKNGHKNISQKPGMASIKTILSNCYEDKIVKQAHLMTGMPARTLLRNAKK